MDIMDVDEMQKLLEKIILNMLVQRNLLFQSH